MRREGKHIDHWKFEFEGNHVKVDVRLAGVKFWAYCDEPEMQLHGCDLAKLKDEARKYLAPRVTTAWEEFYIVELSYSVDVQDQRGETEEWRRGALLKTSTNTSLEYRTVQIGTRGDGSKCHRDRDRNPSHVFDGMPEIGLEPATRSDGQTSLWALVPATDNNLAALASIVEGFRGLHRRLTDFLHPDVIVPNLAKQGQLLVFRGDTAAPPPATATKKAKRKT